MKKSFRRIKNKTKSNKQNRKKTKKMYAKKIKTYKKIKGGENSSNKDRNTNDYTDYIDNNSNNVSNSYKFANKQGIGRSGLSIRNSLTNTYLYAKGVDASDCNKKTYDSKTFDEKTKIFNKCCKGSKIFNKRPTPFCVYAEEDIKKRKYNEEGLYNKDNSDDDDDDSSYYAALS